jgi:Asp-tRNA(Asn)/Glu-tRNA(Gln) amidotransferase A subunit family amidase
MSLKDGRVQAKLAQCYALIAQQDQRWRAMLALNPAAAQEAADADGRDPVGQLDGFVLAVKDNIDLFGMATSSGCKALVGAMPRRDAAVVARLRAAGAIVLGKTNLSELSFEIRSRSSLGGDVLCPFAPQASAGGSSGGSAVAVACGFADGALGTDTGGSIRIPAACNGVVGFRPAHGSLPMAGIAPLAPSTDTVGPIARHVEDAAMLYQAMGGSLTPHTKANPKVGVLRQAFGDDPAIHTAMEQAMARLCAQGVTLLDPFVVEDIEDLLAGEHIVDAEFAAAFDAYLASNFLAATAPENLAELLASGAYLPEYRPVLERRITAAPQAEAILARHRLLEQKLSAAMAAQGLDALLYPTMRVIPQDLDNPKGGWAAELAARTGWPAITVPCAPQGASRPVGAELMAPRASEGLLFALAKIIHPA